MKAVLRYAESTVGNENAKLLGWSGRRTRKAEWKFVIIFIAMGRN